MPLTPLGFSFRGFPLPIAATPLDAPAPLAVSRLFAVPRPERRFPENTPELPLVLRSEERSPIVRFEARPDSRD
jgi:hypothetical protein